MDGAIKYDLTDEDIQNISEKLRKILDETYKDEISGVPDHIKSTLCQNFAIQCKNNNMNIDKLLDEAGITD